MLEMTPPSKDVPGTECGLVPPRSAGAYRYASASPFGALDSVQDPSLAEGQQMAHFPLIATLIQPWERELQPAWWAPFRTTLSWLPSLHVAVSPAHAWPESWSL
jgi:hypothetical protein